MSGALRPRGPDDDARWVGTTDPVALGFRFLRTAIGETSPGVIVNEDRSLMMVCDGHVFNAGALRSYLRDRGHTMAQRIRANCSCISAKTKASPDGGAPTASLRWRSGTRGALVLGRDFLGVRPLYWSRPNGIVFASEIKALLRNRSCPRRR